MKRLVTVAAACLAASGASAATYQLTSADVANNGISLAMPYVITATSGTFSWDGVSSFSVPNVVLDSDGLPSLSFPIDATWTADSFSFNSGNSYSLSESNGNCVPTGPGTNTWFCGDGTGAGGIGASGSVRADILGDPASITFFAGGFTWDSGVEEAPSISNFGNRLVLNFTEQAVVPVPAAVWLFGSAIAGLGLVRRRMQAAL